jgi:hypothetical protein
LAVYLVEGQHLAAAVTMRRGLISAADVAIVEDVNMVGGEVCVPGAVARTERRRYGVAARMPATMKVRL